MAKLTASKIIEIAESYVGYMEKKDGAPKYLTDSKANYTMNVGMNNYTLFGKWYGEVAGVGNPNPWCAFFISWLFFKATGNLADTKDLLCGNIFSYCPTGVTLFKSRKQFHTADPKAGDIIFFTNGSRAYHTGLVYKVDSSRVYTIEGNTSSSSGVIENGGCVAKKSYLLTYNKIMGYGRPDYKLEAIKKTDDWIARLQKTIGAKIDNIAGNETLSKTPTIKRGDKGDVVKLLQERLTTLGYDTKGIDGSYGKAPYSGTYDAVIKYQKEVVKLKNPDGEFTSKGTSWRTILGMK